MSVVADRGNRIPRAALFLTRSNMDGPGPNWPKQAGRSGLSTVGNDLARGFRGVRGPFPSRLRQQDARMAVRRGIWADSSSPTRQAAGGGINSATSDAASPGLHPWDLWMGQPYCRAGADDRRTCGRSAVRLRRAQAHRSRGGLPAHNARPRPCWPRSAFHEEGWRVRTCGSKRSWGRPSRCSPDARRMTTRS